MTKTNSPEQRKTHDFNIERFKTRFTAKSCVVFVAVAQIITRLITVLTYSELKGVSRIAYWISIPLFFLMALIVCIEFVLFKKIGPKVMDYSKIIDFILLLIFTCEWITTLTIALSRISATGIGLKQLDSLFGYTSFGWRIIFLLFLMQNWMMIVIPPVIATSLVIGFILHDKPGGAIYVLMMGILQIVCIVWMLYLQDRVKWKEILTNVQQERWMQVNNFILNNIPENIVILELGGQLGGEVKFINDYCKSFMRKLHVSQDPKDLFHNIKDLNQQPETEPSSPSNSSRPSERFGALNIFLEPTTMANNHINYQNLESLEELIQNFKEIIRDANLQERQFLVYTGKLQVESHQKKSIEVKVSFIQQHNKEYIVLIIRDTTQRDLLVTLEDNNKYKDQLLASVSHELRAPLNGNINLVDSALQNKDVPNHIKERLLTPALRSSKFLLHLINDILDMSQIKAQKLRLIFKTGKLSETLNDTLQLVELQAKKKNIELALVIHPDAPFEFCTDHVRLSQIVLNLLNNAIKFTQKGSIVLSVHPIEDSGCLKISVQDSGLGMKKEDIKKLFSDYTHIEFAERAAINPTGVGLGLSIAYNLAKLLGPTEKPGKPGIQVESVIHKGSTFSFLIEDKENQLDIKDLTVKSLHSDQSDKVADELYVTEPDIVSKLSRSFSKQKLLSPDSERPKQCNCAKVLVVDDNPFNTMAFETVLGSLNFKCDSVFDGQTAIDKILYRQNTHCGENCRPYCVVFMDQEMPGMTGSETVRELKKLQSQDLAPLMKIIGCTAHGSAQEVAKFMESGIDLCIHKPINPSELQKILHQCETAHLHE